jgi:leader peptidase (prepilin peptidase)/N-methyltransferase
MNGLTINSAMMTIVAGILVAAPLFLLWAVSRGRWMGFGDVKLAVGMGMMLGALGGGSALVFAVWLGAIGSLLFIAYGQLTNHLARFAHSTKRLTIKSEIPFGPFLVAGTLLVFFTHLTLWQLIGMFS